MTLQETSNTKSFDGWLKQFNHYSDVLNCDMRFSIYLPEEKHAGETFPVLYWLSGLTCTDENFMQKAGAQRIASELRMAIVAPDTSPRGESVADDEQYDLGKGAGFYLNATQSPWAEHYHMYDYIVHELPALIEANFPVSKQRAISGHSMGGHGALTIGLKNPGMFSSISAFSPICHPVDCPWGQKAFTTYLGSDTKMWAQYDASLLLKQTKEAAPILIDQGSADNFLKEQLKPEALDASIKGKNLDFQLRHQSGYDHSYYFIASFIEDHLRFHARYF